MFLFFLSHALHTMMVMVVKMMVKMMIKMMIKMMMVMMMMMMMMMAIKMIMFFRKCTDSRHADCEILFVFPRLAVRDWPVPKRPCDLDPFCRFKATIRSAR